MTASSSQSIRSTLTTRPMTHRRCSPSPSSRMGGISPRTGPTRRYASGRSRITDSKTNDSWRRRMGDEIKLTHPNIVETAPTRSHRTGQCGRRVRNALTHLRAVVRLHEYPLERKGMALNEALLKRLIETPGVSGREERQREIAREELGSLTDEVRTDSLGSVIGTKRARDDVRVMVAAHMDEIGFLVKHVDDKGFIRLQGLGGHDPANMVSQRVIVTTAECKTFAGALLPAC